MITLLLMRLNMSVVILNATFHLLIIYINIDIDIDGINDNKDIIF